jgi:hypothetical protein
VSGEFSPNSLGVTINFMVSYDGHSHVGFDLGFPYGIHEALLCLEEGNRIGIGGIGYISLVENVGSTMSVSSRLDATAKVVPVLLFFELRVMVLVFLDTTLELLAGVGAELVAVEGVVTADNVAVSAR